MNESFYKPKTNRLLFFAGFLLLVCLNQTFAQEERAWKTFSPEKADWSILAPGTLNPDASALEANSRAGSFSFTDASRFFAVVYQDNSKFAKSVMSPFLGSYYKKVRKSFVKSSKGKLLKEQKFTNGNISGREVWIQMPDGKELNSENQVLTRYRVERMRMFFNGARFYMLLAVLPENEINSATANDFFNSFRFN